ncbi:hypothetical protein [Methylobacterium sp. 391_Methyba4]|uniref:hypothetical protein n=1 Tax=Methylobacterium sp. 391_Methyba4 TaxID=3038924 RepID=UPI00241C4FAA|nr:hypothetical protein [Methylobacterium sp. 391_Methyba4]WFS06241.1 hypothetical protein P9K36_22990 [Methylobacterium sp. 391_Methyba4]
MTGSSEAEGHKIFSVPPTFLEISAALDPQPFVGGGSAFSDPIHLEVGRVCGSFEKLQDEMMLLFNALCNGNSETQTSMLRIIASTSSFGVKLDLCKEAARTFIEDEAHCEAVLGWLKLCSKASEIRNKIAHGQPANIHYNHGAGPDRGIYLVPCMYNPRKGGFPRRATASEYCWNVEQIRNYYRAFHALYAMMMTVREQLLGSGDEDHPQVLDPATMRREQTKKSKG